MSDINQELITTYCCVRDNVDKLIERVKKHDIQHIKNNRFDFPKKHASRLIMVITPAKNTLRA